MHRLFKSYGRTDIQHNSHAMSIVPPGTPESNEVVSDETLHFDYPGSDIILRLRDAHDFRVPKLFIINSSPVLRELI